jgi:hypothetical protein
MVFLHISDGSSVSVIVNNIVAYTPDVRQRPLSKQMYYQSLLGNNSVNNRRCQVMTDLCNRGTVFSMQSVPRSNKWEMLFKHLYSKLQTHPLVREGATN